MLVYIVTLLGQLVPAYAGTDFDAALKVYLDHARRISASYNTVPKMPNNNPAMLFLTTETPRVGSSYHIMLSCYRGGDNVILPFQNHARLGASVTALIAEREAETENI